MKLTARRGPTISALIIAGAMLLSGCAGSETELQTDGAQGEAEVVRLAFFASGFANSYSQAEIEGAQAAADDLGAELTLHDGNFDVTTQTSQMQSVLASGVADAIMLNALGTKQVVQYIEEAGSKGIPVVCIMNNCGDDLNSLIPTVPGQTAVTGFSVGAQGKLIAEQALEVCGDKETCRVAIVQGMSVMTTDVHRTKSMRNVLDAADGVEVVTVQDGNLDQQASYNVVQNILTANSDIDVLLVTGDQMAAGAYRAVSESGIDAAIVSVGASKQGVDSVREGRFFSTIALLPYTEGYEGARQAILAARGEKFEASIDVTELSPVGPVVNRENAGDFDAEWTE